MSPKQQTVTITSQPKRIAAGGVVTVTAELPPLGGKYAMKWIITGPAQLSAQDRHVALGATTVTGRQVTLGTKNPKVVTAMLDTGPLPPGAWNVEVALTKVGSKRREALDIVSSPIEVRPRPFAAGDDVAVTMKRSAVAPTSDQALWVAISAATEALGFESYRRFIDAVMCGDGELDESLDADKVEHRWRKVKKRTALPFPHVDRYRLLKAATEVFLMTRCGVDFGDFSQVDLEEEGGRLNRSNLERGDLESQMRDYLERVRTGQGDSLGHVLPYFALIRQQLGESVVVRPAEGDDEAAAICYGILAEKLTHPCFIELIHEYWLDEGNLVRSIGAISRRFQNRTAAPPGRDPLAGLDVDPLRPLNALLWGLVQDRQHRLTSMRRNIEYSHHYGVGLSSRPPVRGADPRSRFMPAFHNLLSLCSDFYEQDDNTTVIADGFGVLNALKETHLLLTEGAHNQYGELPWTARHEMLMYQWILSRPEMGVFLPGRTMVVYPEPWISAVEAMNRLQGWSNAPVLHYRDLAVFGEQLMLSIRFGAWTTVTSPDQAANWARYQRQAIKAYMHAHQAIGGGDLSRRRDRSSLRQRPRAGALHG